jgi:acetyltransferase-like isoleucine patch superfamily enzyme
MTEDGKQDRLLEAVHANKPSQPDPSAEIAFSDHLRENLQKEEIIALYPRFSKGLNDFDQMMRRIIFRSLAKKVGNDLEVGANVGFKHLETFQIGNNVFIGESVYLQGRLNGVAKIGDGCWIGPQAYLDARNLELGKHVGWGPGAKVLGSEHTAIPIDEPVISTTLRCKPVVVEDWADIGTNAVILPGVRIGKGAIIGAGAVVNKDIPQFTVAAGVPAKFIRNREDKE